ncbi:MAG: shikimate dehydrogenase [Candidatus Methylarchaceae archaeon HK02M2]|nr:shikimate dehydrogenase [Candidatus Methylarchaceae archaeon HK02M2]
MVYFNWRINSKTQLYCVIGHPVETSLSPIMQNEAFRAKNLDYVYLAFDVEDLEQAIIGLKVLGVKGFNVTMPHKVSIINFLDKIDESASLVGAVNTVVNHDGDLIGYNTDVDGVVSALKTVTNSLLGSRALLIGAGGAARACIVALVSLGCNEIVVLNRTLDKAKSMIKELSKKLDMICAVGELTSSSLKRAMSSINILLNATPIGAYPKLNESIIKPEFFRVKDIVVFDVVYKPKKTKLIKDAERVGAKIIPGYEMFVGQGAKSFKLWTGINAPIEIMKKAVLEVLE